MQTLSDAIEVISNDIFKNIPLSDVLLKAKMLPLMCDLDMPEFQEWLENEINGYKNTEEVPVYRIIHCIPKVDLRQNINGQIITRQELFRPNDMELEFWRSLNNFPYLAPITNIENPPQNEGYLALPLPLALSGNFQKIFPHHQITSIFAEFPSNQLLSILSSIKSKLINFLQKIRTKHNLKPIQIMEHKNEQNSSVNMGTGTNVVINNSNNAQIGNDNTNTTNQNANISTINAGDLEAFKESWADFKAQFAQEKKKNSATLSTEDAEDIETQIATIDTQLARKTPKQNMIVGNLKTLSGGIGIGVLGNWASNYAIPLLENMIKTAVTIFG